MPKSRVRKKKVYSAPTEVAAASASKQKPSPRWLPVTALAFVAFGMVWLVVYYMTQGAYPLSSLGPWNIAIGFTGIVVALGMFTQWR